MPRLRIIGRTSDFASISCISMFYLLNLWCKCKHIANNIQAICELNFVKFKKIRFDMDKGLMLEQLINYYSNGNKARFASLLGVRPQTINTWIARNTFDAELIYSKCESISGDWLLSGEGDMCKKEKSVENNCNKQNANTELLSLCKSLVESYQQRDDVMNKLVSMVNGMK